MAIVKKLASEEFVITTVVEKTNDIIDATLAQSGMAADAKAVGDALAMINSYIFNIDYDAILAFDTSEIIFSTTTTTSVLGQAILGQMILA